MPDNVHWINVGEKRGRRGGKGGRGGRGRKGRCFDTSTFFPHILVRPLSAAPAILIPVLYFDCLYILVLPLSTAQLNNQGGKGRCFDRLSLILVRHFDFLYASLSSRSVRRSSTTKAEKAAF